MNTVPAFGDFADPQRYTGFVPSVSYLTAMSSTRQLNETNRMLISIHRVWRRTKQISMIVLSVHYVIEKKDSGSLDSLAAKFLGVFLSKDRSLRTGEHWEQSVIASDLLNYAALDVYASRLIFDELSKTAALQRVQHDTPPGTRVALLTREGGAIAAYGQISHVQTSTYAGVRITKSRVLVDSDSVVIPSAAAILHFAPTNTSAQTKTKSDTLTLSHLRSLSNSPDSSFHLREPSERQTQAAPASSSAVPLDPALFHHTASSDLDPNEEEQEEDMDDKLLENEDQAEERLRTQMLEAHAEAGSGGPHSDIYRKFGAFHANQFQLVAAPRLTVNSLTDHRTYYNLQAMAKHEFGVNWEYHHDLALINRTSFLLNYLADIVPGVESYADWLNPDLYERTTEKFGICEVPESYAEFSCWNRVFSKPTGNGPYDENAVERFKLNGNNDWLRRCQGVALPIVPPTTPEARKYYFANVGDFVVEASISGKRKIGHESFANRWNSTADGKTRFYVSADLLAAFAKSWEKTNNARASQELISAKVDLAHQTRQLFQETNNLPFPNSLLGTATSSHPQEGLIEFEAGNPVPDSISTDIAISRPQIQSIAPSRQKLRTSSKEKSSANSVPTASQASHRISIQPSTSTEVRTL
ncbi:hypothetical protein R3P38DRAFT_2812412 [Favolaschia claudopus]|uniref:3'-5' exonuclease domain-containing protein n=1 Tax=Favolaschia claudopus TaxID=2862362 RepID=A0AAV9Z6Z3_9AGAR